MLGKSIFLFFIFNTIVFAHYDAQGQINRVENHFDSIQNLDSDSPQTIQFISEEDNLVQDYSKLNQIILLRHGEPALDKEGKRKRKEAIKFIQAYDSVGIYPPKFKPIALSENELSVIYTSTLPRSINTAELVFNRADLHESLDLFREIERKIFSFPNIRLRLNTWLTTSRIFWFMRFNKKGIESFSKAKKRAKKATAFLEEDAAKNGKTLLVSHGLLNHFLVKYLKKDGWHEVYDGGKGYLSQKVLIRYEP